MEQKEWDKLRQKDKIEVIHNDIVEIGKWMSDMTDAFVKFRDETHKVIEVLGKNVERLVANEKKKGETK